MLIRILASLGFLLSAYAFYVIKRTERSGKYKPLCDISENVSCTKAFISEYGSLMVLPNPLLGILFYALMIIIGEHQVIFYLSSVAFAFTFYLAYLSYVKQKNFCLVCSAIYVVNVLLFLFSLIVIVL